MRILLTGGNGMVGRNLLENPGASQHQLWAPSRKEVDLLDLSSVRQALRDYRPELVLHAAGRVGGIAANIAAPYEFLFENLEMGKNLIAGAREMKVPRFLNYSSSCVYPRFGKNPLREEDMLTGELEPTNEGYAIAKVSVMRLGEFAAKNGSLDFKSLIPCNLYGRFDHFDPIKSHLLPSIVMKLHQAKSTGASEVDIWGTGEVRREFMTAGDLASVTFRCLGMFDQLPRSMNVGLGHDHTVNEYYQTAAKVIGYSGRFVHDTTKPEGMKQKLVDNSRMKGLGLVAPTSLETGITLTYDYYLQTLQGKA